MLCVGYLGELVEQSIGPERFGVQIAYSFDGAEPLGTLGAVRNAASLLGDRFLVLYGDTYLRIDYGAAAAAWRRSGLPAMMSVLRNEGRWDASNVSFDGEVVTAYDKRNPTGEMDWIDYGFGGFRAAALDAVEGEISDLADLYSELANRRLLFGYAATERFYEIGTPEALAETSTFLTVDG